MSSLEKEYLAQAQHNRQEVWQALFEKIGYAGDPDQPITEEELWLSEKESKLVKSFVQIYNLFKESIDEASESRDSTKVETLGPFACVMFPIVFNEAKKQNAGCSTFDHSGPKHAKDSNKNHSSGTKNHC